jgi:hypothetical protein
MSGESKKGLSRRAILIGVGGGVLATATSAGRAPARGAGRLTLTLRADPLTARFANPGNEPVQILKPLDGSEWGWIMPHYRLTVIDANDREWPLSPRCKLFGFPYMGTTWPGDYVLTIPPGGEHLHSVGHNHALAKEGMYRVRLEYLFTPKLGRIPSGARYPEGLWVGSVISNTIEVPLSPRR